MPLVVPGITGTSGDKTEEWTNKLVGKKLSEGSSDEVVREPGSFLDKIPPSRQSNSSANAFPELLQEGSPRGVPCHRARHDGHQGLQARQTQRPPQGGRHRQPRPARLSK